MPKEIKEKNNITEKKTPVHENISIAFGVFSLLVAVAGIIITLVLYPKCGWGLVCDVAAFVLGFVALFIGKKGTVPALISVIATFLIVVFIAVRIHYGVLNNEFIFKFPDDLF